MVGANPTQRQSIRPIVGRIEQTFPRPGLPDLMSESSFCELRPRGFDDDLFSPRRPRGFGAPAPRLQITGGAADPGDSEMVQPGEGLRVRRARRRQRRCFPPCQCLGAVGRDVATLQPGVTLRVRVGQGQKGPQADEALEIDESTAAPPRTAALGSVLLPRRVIAALTA